MSSSFDMDSYSLRLESFGARAGCVYRWLNAKIRLDTGTVMSDPYAHKCCKTLGVKSGAKHYKYKKPGNPFKIYPNLLMTEMQIDRPLQCIVSDMTAFYVKGIYYELALYIAVLKNVMYAATSCSTGLSPVTWKSMKISALIHPLMDSIAALSVGVCTACIFVEIPNAATIQGGLCAQRLYYRC